MGLASQVTQKASQVKRLDPWSLYLHLPKNNLLVSSLGLMAQTSSQTNSFTLAFHLESGSSSMRVNLSSCVQLQQACVLRTNLIIYYEKDRSVMDRTEANRIQPKAACPDRQALFPSQDQDGSQLMSGWKAGLM